MFSHVKLLILSLMITRIMPREKLRMKLQCILQFMKPRTSQKVARDYGVNKHSYRRIKLKMLKASFLPQPAELMKMFNVKIDSGNCRGRDWAVDFSAAGVNLEN